MLNGSKVGYGGGCDGLGGGCDGACAGVVACDGGVACGEWLLFGSSGEGKVVVPRFNVTLTSCSGEVIVVLLGEDSLDEPRLMWLDGRTLMQAVHCLT
uniref:Uncharacterized protein n=1 Tax=Tanacetum cinerariifolium TaxID=118510 RepID=A0A699IY33_TANCI|nr:hypothetical protein [Tanacetum cinerariifolium]